jgi:hypothetical protein
MSESDVIGDFNEYLKQAIARRVILGAVLVDSTDIK